jgi:hypothetical protein
MKRGRHSDNNSKEYVILVMIPEDAIETKYYATSIENWESFNLKFHAIDTEDSFLFKIHYFDNEKWTNEREYEVDKSYWTELSRNEFIDYQIEYSCTVLVHPWEY